jgi:hypothetical protein
MGDPFALACIARLKTLSTLTLWRVGQLARGPGREPEMPMLAVAVHNHAGWVYRIDGNECFDSTTLGAPPDANELDAQSAVVRLVVEATGRNVHVAWTEVDADTWTAAASFAD